MKLPNGEIVISEMSPGDLKNLCKPGKDYLEFKRRPFRRPKKLPAKLQHLQTVQGGTILVGVDDNGSIPGIREYFEEEFLLFKAAYGHCVPEVPINIELIHVGPVDVIIVRVQEADEKPIYNKSNKKRRVYVRRDDASMLASDELVEVLKQQYSAQRCYV